MDDDALVLLFAVVVAAAMATSLFALLRNRVRDRRARITVPTSRASVVGIPPASRAARPGRRHEPPERAEVDLCLDRLLVKRAVDETYAGVTVDDIPSVVLHQLDAVIEQSAYIKHTHNILGKIDALEDNVEELVDLVATDPLLSATVLRQANSAYYGARGGVTSLRFAIELLGQSALKGLVYREYVLREHKGKPMPDPALFQAVWEHALLCATAAAYLAPAFPGMDPAGAYTIGLLHDIGKFLLLSSGQVEVSPDRCVRPYCGCFMRDTALVWRYDHALAGKIAALKWEFGPEVAGAIGMHHYPELVNVHRVKAGQGLIRALVVNHIANQVAKCFSGERNQACLMVPLHFSYHHLVDREALRAVLRGSNLIPELAKVKAGMSFVDGA